MGVTDNFYLLLGFRVSPGELVADCSLRVELPSGTSQQVTTTIHYSLLVYSWGGGILYFVAELIVPYDIVTDHSDVYDILRSRHEVLKEIRAEWSVSEPKVTSFICTIYRSNAEVLYSVMLCKIK